MRRFKSRQFRELLDRHGYTKTESILNEWNYVKNWTTDFPYSASAISQAKGGAYAAAFMSICQDEPIDMLMYYDARPATIFNGLFDYYTYAPRPAYYALFSWADLRELGTQVMAKVEFPDRAEVLAKAEEESRWEFPPLAYESKYIITNEVVTATAAKGKDGGLGILVARFVDDDNVTAPEKVSLRLACGGFSGRVRAYVTDDVRLHSPIHLTPDHKGTVSFNLAPNAFAYVETKFRGLSPNGR